MEIQHFGLGVVDRTNVPRSNVFDETNTRILSE